MKKKLNIKKTLAAIGLLAVTVPVVFSVVACQANMNNEDKISLVEALKYTVVGSDTTEANIVSKVLERNSNSGLTLNDIAVKSGSFNFASEAKDGSAVIIAKSGSKYTGEVTIITVYPGIPESANRSAALKKLKEAAIGSAAENQGWADYAKALHEDMSLFTFIFTNKDIAENEVEKFHETLTNVIVKEILLTVKADFAVGELDKKYDIMQIDSHFSLFWQTYKQQS